jgi:tetratricopeptide (TPR) repeat protein
MTPPEIDQLIEEGLTLYGQGDLDGALLAWEKALAADPENAQASSYVDYVRQNYDLLTGDAVAELDAPFGIDDEPYQIEILPGEWERLSAPSIGQPASIKPPRATSDVDEGWFMDDDESARLKAAAPLEIEAEEPPAVNFDDETREYQSGSKRAPSHDSARTEFGSEQTPVSGFHSQPTNLRERDTGFVKPTRTTKQSQPPPVDPFSTMSMPKLDNLPPEPALASASISLSYDDPSATLSPEGAELVSTLPSPTPRESVESLTLGAPLDPLTGKPRTGTAELPQSLRLPAITEAPPPIAFGATMTRDVRTRDFDTQPTKSAAGPKAIIPSATPTRELKPSELSFGNMVSAPTRDLGIRPLGITGTATAPPLPDDEQTSQHRAAPPVGEGTRADLILPFDPIDARTAQILDEIDEGVEVEGESKEDKTRRRITLLFERALQWSQSGELDKSVAAIDLALSEDPNSALGQKLIHRHRDQMLNVFQAFLGDLQRQPMLARPLHELASAPISPRAAFLLSRIDGQLSMDELLDVSGMPRIEAYRYLCQLFLRGILR